MTPKETFEYIEAFTWRMDQEQRERIWTVWHIAAFTRAKRLPAYETLIQPKDGKQLSEEEKRIRQEEFEELRKRMG